jgi:hypothetical protein
VLTANAQRVVNHQALYWLRYQNQLLFSPTLYWNTEIESRRFFNPDVQNQFIIHSHLHYKRNQWDVGIGPTLSWAYAQKPALGYDHAVNEIRGVSEVAFEVPLGKIYFQNRIRLDHRFFQEEIGKSVFEESLYVLRFRYRAQIRIPVKTNIENIPTIYLRLANEVMLNHIRNTFDQNRIYVTSDINISKKITLELAYIYIYQQRVGQDEYFERHVVRFTVLHKISLY